MRADASPLTLRPPVAGSALPWARDLALVGVLTGALAPYMVIGSTWFALGGGLAGGLGGALLGALAPATLQSLRGRVPLGWLWVGATGLGAAWGGLAGSTGALLAITMEWANSEAIGLGAVFGGIAGAIQLGWLAPLYLGQAVRRGWRWPLVGIACALAPALGGVSLLAILVLILPFSVAFVCIGLAGWIMVRAVNRSELRARLQVLAVSDAGPGWPG